jgi:hypothetical protein
MALTDETKERVTALVTKHMPSEAQAELIEMCNEIGSIQAANFLVETLAAIQDASMAAEVRADEAAELATAAYESLQNLIDAHGQWQQEEMQPLLDQIWEEGLSVELMVAGLMKHLGVSVEEIVRLAREHAASSDHQDRYNQSISDTAHSRSLASTQGNGARKPLNSLGHSTGYVKESYQQVGRRRALLPGF